MAVLKSSECGSEFSDRCCRGLVRECKFQRPAFKNAAAGPLGSRGRRPNASKSASLGVLRKPCFCPDLRARRRDLKGGRRMMKPDGEKGGGKKKYKEVTRSRMCPCEKWVGFPVKTEQ